ncbi:D-alanyl-D-alanine carboxypeptidase family protein [Streptomyces sp. NPDC058623]|uniref:D-alanyl-D-alanine carboxypeptidase family protein n=1 Tax=Streptomyces sp. NPDC058623 TaxID=3346563 RepID=UPI003664FAFA
MWGCRRVDPHRLGTGRAEDRGTNLAGLKGASSAQLKASSTPTVRQLLYAMMLPSGCDAAYALADTFGTGTTTSARTTDFIAQMNTKAQTVGMTNTVFDSFDGISPTANNLSTPRDLAKLTQHAMTAPLFRPIVKTTTYSTGGTGGTSALATWSNSNLLVQPRPTGYGHPGAVGVKTGTTTAGKWLVFSVTRNENGSVKFSALSHIRW